MITYKIFNLQQDSDFSTYYPIVYKWWQDWDFSPVVPDMLSTRGIMVFNQGLPICAGWLYSTDSNTALFNWIISSREHKEKRKGCMEQLFTEAEKLANNLGFGLLGIISVSNPFLSNKVQKLGFDKYIDKNTNNYFKAIDG